MLPARGATFYAYRKRINSTFQSTLPARGATARDDIMHYLQTFQSTLPARGATLAITMRTFRACYFNPRSPHGERHCRLGGRCAGSAISIHAPRTGSDRYNQALSRDCWISIHAPRTGSDLDKAKNIAILNKFQSTLPARGATSRNSSKSTPVVGFQSTLPARGATDSTACKSLQIFHFNPRSPHGERQI